MLTAEFWLMFAQGLWETIYVVVLSTLFSYIIGLPLGLLLAVTDADGAKLQGEFDFSTLGRYAFNLNIDIGAGSYWSELMQVQTMDNLFAKKILTDAVTYIESIPGKYLRNKDKIIEKIKEQQEMLAQQQAMMQQTASIPETEMPVTDTTTQELVNQVAAARSEVMGKARQMT